MNFLETQKLLNNCDPSKIWVSSDFHFSHKNLIMGTSMWDDKSTCRDFDDISEHDNYILNEINSKVKEDDILIHCGDFSFGRKENINWFSGEIKCRIVNLNGNHDHNIRNEENQKYFLSCLDYLEFRVNNQLIICSHYPIIEWNEVNRGSIHFFGHTHQFKNDFNNRSMNVGLEANNMKIWNLIQILDIMKSVPVSKHHHDGQRF